MRERIAWLDCLKGASIVLVVLFHTQFVVDQIAWQVDMINRVMRPIRMPAFFMASGMLTHLALQLDWESYFQRRAGPLLYTFLVWTLLTFLLSHLLPWPPPIPPHELPGMLLRPYDHLWFVLDLFLFVVAARLLARFPAATLAAATAYAALFWYQKFDEQAVTGLRYFPFFAAGAYYMPQIRRLLEGRPLAIAAGAAALWLALPFAYGALPTSVVGVAGFAAVLIILSRTPLERPLEYVGSHSVAVYLLHWLVMANLAALWPWPVNGLAGGLALTTFGVAVPVLIRPWLPEILFAPPRQRLAPAP